MDIQNKILNEARYVSFKHCLCNQNIANSNNSKYREVKAVDKKIFLTMYKNNNFSLNSNAMSLHSNKKVDVSKNLIETNENINHHSYLLSLYKSVDNIFKKSNLK